MGRKEKFTPAEVATALRAHDGIVSRAAKALDCTTATVWRYITLYKSVAKVLDETRQLTVDVAENVVAAALLDGDVVTARWVLGTMLASDRGYVALSRRELTGADGGALALDVDARVKCVRIEPEWDLSKLSVEELDDLLEMAERATGQTRQEQRELQKSGGCGECSACRARRKS